ncbi:YlzJ-like family protein [Desulfolucanica intricata]|uniref:YlzJ-like family protein n=1 Tax=Desulfolucanica intricata TaxID=1285191 RepID=UPI00082F3102|nr:YlzJ-like family protein [Desulfolucanica intricata]
MILYTPMQLELVFEGLEPQQETDYRKVSYQGIPLLVNSAGEVVRVLSTDPNDFMRPDICPGAKINQCMFK